MLLQKRRKLLHLLYRHHQHIPLAAQRNSFKRRVGEELCSQRIVFRKAVDPDIASLFVKQTGP